MRRNLLVGLLLTTALPASAQVIGGGLYGGNKPPCANCMTTAVIARNGSASAPSTSAINFASIMGSFGQSSFIASAANKQVILPVTGTISNISVLFTSTVTANSWDVGIAKNGTMTNAKCNVTATACSLADDGTGSTEASFVPGDAIAIETCPSGVGGCTAGSAPTGGGAVFVAFTFKSTVGQESFVCAGGQSTNTTGGTTQQWAPVQASVPYTVTEINGSTVFPVAGTLDTLWAATNGNFVSTEVVTAYQNGSAKALTCTITSGSNSNKCNTANGVNSFSVAALDTVSASFAPTTGATGHLASACMRWVPTTANQAIVAAVSSTIPGTVANTRFGNLQGDYANSSTEGPANGIAPIIPGGKTLTFANLVAAVSTAPTTGSRTTSIRVGNATPGTPPSGAITSGTTLTIGGVASTPAVQDVTHTATATSSQTLDMQNVTVANVAAVTWYKYAMSSVLN